MLKSVSLVLPFYNEINYIKIAIMEATSVLDSLGLDYEIILADDGSNDGSEKISDELANSNHKIKVIHHDRNKKLGAILRSGFFCASKEIIIYTDIDMPFELSLLKNAIPLIENSDIVTGYKMRGERSFKRIIYSKCYNFLVKSIFHINVKDINCAMKIFKRDILNILDLKSQGSFINAEFLIKATYLNYRIQEIPVSYIPRKYGKSKLSSFTDIIKIISEMKELYSHILAFKNNIHV